MASALLHLCIQPLALIRIDTPAPSRVKLAEAMYA
jgi:hypothetical protein